MGETSILTILLLLLMGGLGALIKEILVDNKIRLPKIVQGELELGFIGAVIVGAAVGYLVDHSPVMAFFAGYTGFSALGSLIPKNILTSSTFEPDTNTAKEPEKKENSFSIKKPFEGNFGITQKFGENPNWYTANGYAGHFGIDYATPNGTPILACDDGEVTRAEFSTGNGNFCEIKHSWGLSLYCHFKEKSCKKIGDKIKRGETIGQAGNTGAVKPLPTVSNPLAGTHLHFSIKVNGMTNLAYKDFIDPTPFFI